MLNLKQVIYNALATKIQTNTVFSGVHDTPDGVHFCVPLFAWAKSIGQTPRSLAENLIKHLPLPDGIGAITETRGYLNFEIDPPTFVEGVCRSQPTVKLPQGKLIIEHTSVNPNKEWHVGHIRGALIGDVLGRIFRAAGYEVEVQNYIDDTGRQSAESQFAVQHYKAVWDGVQKYDHWLGELYVRLHRDMNTPEFAAFIEPGIQNVLQDLEHGLYRSKVEKVVLSQLETAKKLGVRYDLLAWESDVVKAGFVEKALDVFGTHLLAPTDGKYAGTRGVDLSSFVPGLEEPYKVLVRGNGTYVYETKDIAYHYWKFGLLDDVLGYTLFDPNHPDLYTTTPEPQGRIEKQFAQANSVINVIDARQVLSQQIVKAGLQLVSPQCATKHFHLGNEIVLLNKATMSGRKGITVSADEVIEEAQNHARSITQELNPKCTNLEVTAQAIGLGALKFAFLKISWQKQVNFTWEAALALVGDTSVAVQYASARAKKIIRDYHEQQLSGEADFTQVGLPEVILAKQIIRYDEVIQRCVEAKSPHPLCVYALDLASGLNAYYNHKDVNGKADTIVLKAPAGVREARLMLIACCVEKIDQVLGLLGIETLEQL